jgi:E3 ubiquitin-protein ligase UHRF1
VEQLAQGHIDSYRYDGLYVVEKAWLEKGMNANGYLVCKFALKVSQS